MTGMVICVLTAVFWADTAVMTRFGSVSSGATVSTPPAMVLRVLFTAQLTALE